jgi:hypothetical protein
MQRLGFVFHEDLELKDEFGPMVEAWMNNTGHTDRRILSQDCLHDLLVNCAWWKGKMEADYNRYRGSYLPTVALHGDLMETDNGFRAVGN